MRSGPGKFAALAVLLAFTAAGCGSSDAKPPKLFSEYMKSADVENDTFRDGGNSEQVQKVLAAAKKSKDITTNDVLRAVVLSAYACDEYYNGPPSPDCSPGGEADKAIAAAAGSDGTTHARSLLVKREDGSLEFVTVYVVRGGKGGAVLVDTTGQTYHGGLEDFRENNKLLSADDWMLAPADVTEVPEDDDIPLEIETVTVTGHTPSTWGWWMGAGVLLLAVLLGYLWFTRDPDASRKAPDNSDAGMLGSL